ncbi:MAG: hypothetical protein AB1717_05700 [Pseudomonadota bacterium]
MKLEPITLPVLAQTPLGAYTQLSLGWPDVLPSPLPGQRLRLHDERELWPMRAPHAGQLEALTNAPFPDNAISLAELVGDAIPLAADQACVLVAEGLALAALIHLCSTRRKAPANTLALYQISEPAPFRPRPSRFFLPAMPAGAIAAIPLLEDWGIPSRLCAEDERPGCFTGRVDELAALLPPNPARRLLHLQ